MGYVPFFILIFAAVATAMTWAGYAIRYQRRYGLIAGFDSRQMQRLRDPDALARWVANGCFALAALCVVGILALAMAPDSAPIIVGLVGIANGIVAVGLAAGGIGRGR